MARAHEHRPCCSTRLSGGAMRSEFRVWGLGFRGWGCARTCLNPLAPKSQSFSTTSPGSATRRVSPGYRHTAHQRKAGPARAARALAASEPKTATRGTKGQWHHVADAVLVQVLEGADDAAREPGGRRVTERPEVVDQRGQRPARAQLHHQLPLLHAQRHLQRAQTRQIPPPSPLRRVWVLADGVLWYGGVFVV
eukprot:221299-Rhodomonas_salina.4